MKNYNDVRYVYYRWESAIGDLYGESSCHGDMAYIKDLETYVERRSDIMGLIFNIDPDIFHDDRIKAMYKSLDKKELLFFFHELLYMKRAGKNANYV